MIEWPTNRSILTSGQMLAHIVGLMTEFGINPSCNTRPSSRATVRLIVIEWPTTSLILTSRAVLAHVIGLGTEFLIKSVLSIPRRCSRATMKLVISHSAIRRSAEHAKISTVSAASTGMRSTTRTAGAALIRVNTGRVKVARGIIRDLASLGLTAAVTTCR